MSEYFGDPLGQPSQNNFDLTGPISNTWWDFFDPLHDPQAALPYPVGIHNLWNGMMGSDSSFPPVSEDYTTTVEEDSAFFYQDQEPSDQARENVSRGVEDTQSIESKALPAKQSPVIQVSSSSTNPSAKATSQAGLKDTTDPVAYLRARVIASRKAMSTPAEMKPNINTTARGEVLNTKTMSPNNGSPALSAPTVPTSKSGSTTMRRPHTSTPFASNNETTVAKEESKKDGLFDGPQKADKPQQMKHPQANIASDQKEAAMATTAKTAGTPAKSLLEATATVTSTPATAANKGQKTPGAPQASGTAEEGKVTDKNISVQSTASKTKNQQKTVAAAPSRPSGGLPSKVVSDQQRKDDRRRPSADCYRPPKDNKATPGQQPSYRALEAPLPVSSESKNAWSEEKEEYLKLTGFYSQSDTNRKNFLARRREMAGIQEQQERLAKKHEELRQEEIKEVEEHNKRSALSLPFQPPPLTPTKREHSPGEHSADERFKFYRPNPEDLGSSRYIPLPAQYDPRPLEERITYDHYHLSHADEPTRRRDLFDSRDLERHRLRDSSHGRRRENDRKRDQPRMPRRGNW